jgi:ubiquinol-cytochrome c reductase cytochrome c1 subunit
MKRVAGILTFVALIGMTPAITAHAAEAEKAAEAPAAPAPPEGAVQAESAGSDSHPAESAESGSHHVELPDVKWPFDGIFGKHDRASLQRGFQVYTQVCAACHSMDLLSYRNLTALGYSADEVKAIAASHTVHDGPNDEGDMFDRPGLPSDHFVGPFLNKKAAAAANNGALPPDLSLIAKARHGGASYIYGILTGYEEPPAGKTLLASQHWNKYMSGNVIAMPPPLMDGQVAYEDGSPQTVDQYAKDVASFLTWAAEPHMEDRKQIGLKVLIFLLVFTGIMYAVKKKVWADHH